MTSQFVSFKICVLKFTKNNDNTSVFLLYAVLQTAHFLYSYLHPHDFILIDAVISQWRRKMFIGSSVHKILLCFSPVIEVKVGLSCFHKVQYHLLILYLFDTADIIGAVE